MGLAGHRSGAMMAGMSDFLYTGRLAEQGLGFSYAVTTDVVNEAVTRHDCDPVSAHILGRALTAGLLAAASAPTHQRLNLCWKYSGILRTVLVDAGADGAVRGLVSPVGLADTDGGSEALYGEDGELQGVHSAEGLVVSSGTVPCLLQDVVRDLAFFLSTSDQIETGALVMIGFAADPARPVAICRGLLLQAMPEASLPDFDRLRQALQSETVRSLLGQTVEPDGHIESIVNTLCGGDARGLVYGERNRPRFQCTCDRGKMGPVLRAIPEAERPEILAKGEPLRVHCRYCNQRYSLSPDECRTLWAQGEA